MARSSDARPGVRAGISAGVLGVALLVSAFALLGHAAQGDPLPQGEPLVVTDGRPVHVVGGVEAGIDVREPARCTLASATGTETVEVAAGLQWDGYGTWTGRRLRTVGGEQTTVVCDRRISVTTGPVVLAYPMAQYAILYSAYVMVAVLGFAYARRRSRSRPAITSPVQPGDDENRSELRRFAADVALDVVRVATGVAAVLLGLVGLLVLRELSPAAPIFLIPAGALGGAAAMVARWQRGRRTQRDPAPAPSPDSPGHGPA